jgi:hypothetical protein
MHGAMVMPRQCTTCAAAPQQPCPALVGLLWGDEEDLVQVLEHMLIHANAHTTTRLPEFHSAHGCTGQHRREQKVVAWTEGMRVGQRELGAAALCREAD